MRLRPKRNDGRALRNRRSSDGPRFTVWNEGYNAFLFGASDSRLNISCHSVGVASLRGLTIRPKELSSAAAHHSELTEQVSTIGPDCHLSKQGSTQVAGEITEVAGKVAATDAIPVLMFSLPTTVGNWSTVESSRSAEDPPWSSP